MSGLGAVLTPSALWRRRVEATPEREHLVEPDGRALTVAAVDEAARRRAGALREHGAGPGDRVAVGMRNTVEAALVQRAIELLGGVLVPLVAGLSGRELAYQCEHSEAALAVLEDPVAAALAPHLAELPRLRTVAPGDLREGDPIAADPPPGDGEDAPWAILYTSGSTGRPKGVVLRRGSFVTGGGGYAERFAVRSDDTFVLATPLAHAVGALTAQSIAMHQGCRLAVLDRFSPSSWWASVKRVGGTVTVLFPAQLNLLLETDAGEPRAGESPLRLVMTHAWNARFRERFGVELGLCWGMTETGAISVGTEVGYAGERGEGYVGAPWPSAEVGIFDGDRRLPVGEVGEVALRHPHVMLGYLKDPAATAATVVDGWVRTGDRGSLAPDGHLHFLGRIKNVIKRSGENIGAEEVESALLEHPGVADAVVFGVPDPLRTEEVAAVVAVDPGRALDEAALVGDALERLARWKVPRYVLRWDGELPRLPNGKLDRVAIRAAFDAATPWDRQAEEVR